MAIRAPEALVLPTSVPVLMLVRELNLGGCERDVTRLALGIDRTRYEPHVAAIHPIGLRADELAAAEVKVIQLGFRSFIRPEVFRAAGQIRQYCAEHGIRIVHAWDIPMTLFAAPTGSNPLKGLPVGAANRDRHKHRLF